MFVVCDIPIQVPTFNVTISRRVIVNTLLSYVIVVTLKLTSVNLYTFQLVPSNAHDT